MSETLQPKALCWDLDETIGTFRRISYELEGKQAPDWEPQLSLRYGMKELLSEFSPEAGYVHFITTSATANYADQALNRSGLNEYFRRVFSRNEIVGDQGGKNYTPVAIEMGYSDNDIDGNMLVIGDAPGDRPNDLDIVFIEVGRVRAHQTDALVLREIITTLLEKGDGNFKKGFESLYSESEIVNPEETTPLFIRRKYDLGNGISFEMEYQSQEEVYSFDSEPTVPVITKISAPDYSKPPIDLENKP